MIAIYCITIIKNILYISINKKNNTDNNVIYIKYTILGVIFHIYFKKILINTKIINIPFFQKLFNLKKKILCCILFYFYH